MPEYHSAFNAGETVLIADLDSLRAFQCEWKWHHPLSDQQLAYAAKTDSISRVSYYHGGSPLYEFTNLPGYWHEPCLRDPTLNRDYYPEMGVGAAEYYSIFPDRRGSLPVVIVRDCQDREMLVAFHIDAQRIADAMRVVAGVRSRVMFEFKYGFSGIYESNRHYVEEA